MTSMSSSRGREVVSGLIRLDQCGKEGEGCLDLNASITLTGPDGVSIVSLGFNTLPLMQSVNHLIAEQTLPWSIRRVNTLAVCLLLTCFRLFELNGQSQRLAS